MSISKALDRVRQKWQPLPDALALRRLELIILRQEEAVLLRRYLTLDDRFNASDDPAEKARLNREMVVMDRQRLRKAEDRRALGDDTECLTAWCEEPGRERFEEVRAS